MDAAVGAAVLLAAGCVGVGAPVPGAPAHHRARGFANENPGFARPAFWVVQAFRARLMWASISGGTPNPGFPRIANDGRALRDNRGAPTVTWIGHATLLVQLDGLNVLTDPQFSDRASPVRFAGPRRLNPPGVALEDLPPCRAALVRLLAEEVLDPQDIVHRQVEHSAGRCANPKPVGGRRPCSVRLGGKGSRERRAVSRHEALQDPVRSRAPLLVDPDPVRHPGDKPGRVHAHAC